MYERLALIWQLRQCEYLSWPCGWENSQTNQGFLPREKHLRMGTFQLNPENDSGNEEEQLTEISVDLRSARVQL